MAEGTQKDKAFAAGEGVDASDAVLGGDELATPGGFNLVLAIPR